VDPGSRVFVSDYNSGDIYPFTTGGSAGVTISPGTIYIQAVAVDPATHVVFATAGNNVYVLDLTGVLKTIPVLRSPTAIAIDTVSGNTYVADTYGHSLSLLNTARRSVTGTIPLGTQVFGIAFDASSGNLYGANFGADAVSTFDGAHTFTGSWPSGGGTWTVAVDSGMKLVHALNATDGTLTIFNSTDGSVHARVSLGAVGPGVLAVNSTTDMVYVSGKAGAIWAVNPKTSPPTVVTVNLSDQSTTVGLAIDEGASRVYVAQTDGGGTGTITVLNASTNQAVTTWPSNKPVWKLALDTVMHRLYGTAPDGSDDGTFIGQFTGLLVFDTTSGASIAQIASIQPANVPAGALASANAVAVNPSTHHVFFSDSGNGTVTAVDGSLSVPATIETLVTGTGADGLAVDSAHGLIYAANIADATIAVFADPAAPNPVPAMTSLVPTGAAVGGPAFTLTVNGSNFIPSSAVQWNGSTRATTFIDGAQLQAAILAGDVGTTAAISVTVFNPAPGGGTSNALNFNVYSLQSVNPITGQLGQTLANVAVTGQYTGFVQGTTVAGFGAGIGVNSVTVNSPTTATIGIAIASDATLGVRDITMTTGGEVATLAGGFTVVVVPPALSVVQNPTANFTQGENGATYSVVVSNGGSGGPASGPVTVTENVPAGLVLVSMLGTGWSCSIGGISSGACTNANTLAPGASYATITVTVNVAIDAPASLPNQVSVSNGSSSTTSSAGGSTAIFSRCDLDQDGATTVSDIQRIVNEALGILRAVDDLTHDGVVGAVDVHIVVNMVLGLGCSAS